MDIYEIGLVITIPNFIFYISSYKSFDFKGFQHTYFCKWAI